jgi:hypothetical protein
MVLPPQGFGCRHVDELAELVFRQNRDDRGLLCNQLFGTHQLLAFFAVGSAEAFGAHDKDRGLRRHVVSGFAAVLADERARVAAAERTEFSGEDDDVSGETLTWLVRQCVQSASAAVRESRSKDAAERP